MDKGRAPIKWDVVDLALVGALLGTLVGGMFCCYQMAMGADSHILKYSAIGAVVGALLLGTLSMIRNRIKFR
jgi:uncharacterized membrane protein YeaQ/YmgE (transglycosylase-associated protein family)